MYVFTCVDVNVRIYTYQYMYMYMHVYTYKYVCVDVHTCMNILMFPIVFMYICVYMLIYIHIYIFMYMHMYILMKYGYFYLRESNPRFSWIDANHSAMGARYQIWYFAPMAELLKVSICSRKSWVRLLAIKISKFHHIRNGLADNSTTSLVCILRQFFLYVPTGYYGSPWLIIRQQVRTSSCRAGSPYGILLARNRKCPWMVDYPGYSFTPGLNLDISIPHAHPVHKDPTLWWNLETLISGSRTRDFCEQTLSCNHSATGARYQIWCLAPVGSDISHPWQSG